MIGFKVLIIGAAIKLYRYEWNERHAAGFYTAAYFLLYFLMSFRPFWLILLNTILLLPFCIKWFQWLGNMDGWKYYVIFVGGVLVLFFT